MVSRSKDGELVARSLHRLGYKTVRGSSSAGGREALSELTDLVRAGWGSAIIADGPRGPARQAKIGCVLAGRNSGAPLIPWGCYATPNIRARNWDPFPVSPSTLDAVVLTHAHIDHCGYLPVLTRDGYAGPVWATPGTVERTNPSTSELVHEPRSLLLRWAHRSPAACATGRLRVRRSIRRPSGTRLDGPLSRTDSPRRAARGCT